MYGGKSIGGRIRGPCQAGFEEPGRSEDWELLFLYLTNVCTTLITNVVSSEVVVFGSQQFEGAVNAGWITLGCPDLLKTCDLFFRHAAD